MNKNKTSLALLLLLSGSQLVALNKTIDLNYSADRSKQFVHIKNPERESLIERFIRMYMKVQYNGFNNYDRLCGAQYSASDPRWTGEAYTDFISYSNAVVKLFKDISNDDLKEADEAFNSLLKDQELRANPFKYYAAIAKFKQVVWNCLGKVWIKTSPELIKDFSETLGLSCPKKADSISLGALRQVFVFIYLLNLSENPLGLAKSIVDEMKDIYTDYEKSLPKREPFSQRPGCQKSFFYSNFDIIYNVAKRIFDNCGNDPISIYPTEEKN